VSTSLSELPWGEWVGGLVADIHFAGLPRVTGLCIRYERAVAGYPLLVMRLGASGGSGTM
jgi:hypothetical protein